MSIRRHIHLFLKVSLAALLLAGCGKKNHDGGEGESESGHNREEEAPSGASFKPSKGVILTDETRKILDIEIADVTQQKLPNELAINIQVFSEKHRHALNKLDHTGCDVHGAGLVSTSVLALVKTGQPVRVISNTNAPLAGVVLNVTKALAMGEAEIVVGVSNAAAVLKPGDFVTGRITVPREHAVTVVPKAAVLRTSEGSFVYTVNGDAFFRTAVKTGAEGDGMVEIADGLLAGDQVVTKPVETLWLIELRATKGGGPSH